MENSNNDSTKFLQDNTAADRNNPVLDTELLKNVEEMDMFGEEATILDEFQLYADCGGAPCFWDQFWNDVIEMARVEFIYSVESSMSATNPDGDG